MNIKMLNGNVLVSIEHTEEKTNGGLILPSNTQKSYNIAKVISPDCEGFTKEGDIIYIPRFSGTEIDLEGKKYFIIHIKEIILKI